MYQQVKHELYDYDKLVLMHSFIGGTGITYVIYIGCRVVPSILSY